MLLRTTEGRGSNDLCDSHGRGRNNILGVMRRTDNGYQGGNVGTALGTAAATAVLHLVL